MSRTRSRSPSPDWVSATCRVLRSSSAPPSACSISLICIDSAGCEIEQASAALLEAAVARQRVEVAELSAG